MSDSIKKSEMLKEVEEYTADKTRLEDIIYQNSGLDVKLIRGQLIDKNTYEERLKNKVKVGEELAQGFEWIPEKAQIKQKGKKETTGKVDYTELDWDFIDAMAIRMGSENKYPKGNWKKPIDVEELIKPIGRHFRKVLQPMKGDTETTKEHLVAIALNAMMAAHQLKNDNNG